MVIVDQNRTLTRLRLNHLLASLAEDSQFALQAMTYQAKLANYYKQLDEHLKRSQYAEANRVRKMIALFQNKVNDLYLSVPIQNLVAC